ncbi:MAG TPA: nuclear transport factor 2 family protein, partial [Blastocatellia bacterium]|nr:nuclear transport factor 2 family protein [Blastocatellia bacterium]
SILGQTPSENPRQEKAKDAEHLRPINELVELERSRTVLLVEPERSSRPAIDKDIVRRLEKGIFFARFPLTKFGSLTKRFPPAELNTILAEDYIRIGAGGEIITRQQEIEKPQLSVYPGFVGASIDNLSIRMYGETGIATSLLTIKESRSGVEEIRKYRVTNVYVKRDNRWQLVSSQWTADQG